MKKKGPEEYEWIVRLVLLALMFVSGCFIVRGSVRMASSRRVETEPAEKIRPCVIIDAGHGGADPGKVSVDGSLEKDINLVIAQKLQKFLLMQDVDAVLTRESDAGLYDENASNKKVQDMKNRVALIEEHQPALTVSIHQNSYHEEGIHGAQVFYFTHSTEGERAAGIMQKALLAADQENHRQEKADDGYYLLRRTEVPTIIVECGFLSNYEEADKLVDEKYQKKIAKAVVQGIEEFVRK